MITLTTEEALEFLRQHQPMPDEKEITEEEVQAYNAVRLHFEADPVPECIPLFLNSFGSGSGLGVFQCVEDLLVKFPREAVVPHLRDALKSPHAGVRYWCAQFACSFPDLTLVKPLVDLLEDPEADVRFWAAAALRFIPVKTAVAALRAALEKESDSNVREQMIQAIAALESIERHGS